MKIVNRWTKIRRKIHLIRDKLAKWINSLKEKQRLLNLVNLIRKEYIRSGTTTFKLKAYIFSYNIEPYLDELVNLGSISYTKSELTYEINIKDT